MLEILVPEIDNQVNNILQLKVTMIQNCCQKRSQLLVRNVGSNELDNIEVVDNSCEVILMNVDQSKVVINLQLNETQSGLETVEESSGLY